MTKKIFSDEVEEKIITDYISGETTISLGKKFGVAWGIIHNVLKRHQIACRPRNEMRTSCKIDKNYFKIIDTEEKAYLLGFLYADGGNIGKAIVLCLHQQDRNILDFYHDRLKLTNKITEIKRNGSVYYRLNIGHKEVIDDLVNLGIVQKKTQLIRFPTFLRPELKKHFFRGYFDGDGCLTISQTRNKANFSITSNEDFCKDIKNYMENEIGEILQVVKVKNKNIYRLLCCGNKKILRILDWLYDGSSVYLPRKYEKYQQLKTNPISSKYPKTFIQTTLKR
jgi:intein/homing endonuclease